MIDDVINKLCDDLKPVKPLRHPLLRIIPWLIISVGYTFAIIAWMGIRDDMDLKMDDHGYVFELTVAFSTSIIAALCAVYSSIPDMRGKSGLIAIPATLCAVLFIWLGLRTFHEGFGQLDFDAYHCLADSFLLGFIPTAILVYIVSQGASTRPYMAIGLISLSTSLMAWSALRVTCANDSMGHGCMMHILPFVFFGCILGASAQRFLRW